MGAAAAQPKAPTPLSAFQKTTFADVVKATLAGKWYRAGASGKASAHGEAVTLASLNGRLLVRRAWRGVEGNPSAAYEYQASDDVIAEVRKQYATPKGGS